MTKILQSACWKCGSPVRIKAEDMAKWVKSHEVFIHPCGHQAAYCTDESIKAAITWLTENCPEILYPEERSLTLTTSIKVHIETDLEAENRVARAIAKIDEALTRWFPTSTKTQ